jgi:hypothetical protein
MPYTFAVWREHARQGYAQERPLEERTIVREDGVVTEVIDHHADRRGLVMPFTTLASWAELIREKERERLKRTTGLSDEEFEELRELADRADTDRHALLASIEERVCPPDESHPCQGGFKWSFKRIHLAISDPGAIVGRADYESLPHWQARAVHAELTKLNAPCKSCIQYEFVQYLKKNVFGD